MRNPVGPVLRMGDEVELIIVAIMSAFSGRAITTSDSITWQAVGGGARGAGGAEAKAATP